MTASTASRPDFTPPPTLPPLPADLLDTAVAAELLACSSRTITNLITRGHLPAVRLGPGRTAYRIPASALLDFAARYGHCEPGDVAASADPLPEFVPTPALLLEQRTPEGLRLVTSHTHSPPDPKEG